MAESLEPLACHGSPGSSAISCKSRGMEAFETCWLCFLGCCVPRIYRYSSWPASQWTGLSTRCCICFHGFLQQQPYTDACSSWQKCNDSSLLYFLRSQVLCSITLIRQPERASRNAMWHAPQQVCSGTSTSSASGFVEGSIGNGSQMLVCAASTAYV